MSAKVKEVGKALLRQVLPSPCPPLEAADGEQCRCVAQPRLTGDLELGPMQDRNRGELMGEKKKENTPFTVVSYKLAHAHSANLDQFQQKDLASVEVLSYSFLMGSKKSLNLGEAKHKLKKPIRSLCSLNTEATPRLEGLSGGGESRVPLHGPCPAWPAPTHACEAFSNSESSFSQGEGAYGSTQNTK